MPALSGPIGGLRCLQEAFQSVSETIRYHSVVPYTPVIYYTTDIPHTPVIHYTPVIPHTPDIPYTLVIG